MKLIIYRLKSYLLRLKVTDAKLGNIGNSLNHLIPLIPSYPDGMGVLVSTFKQAFPLFETCETHQ